mgnify:CR=1 FL=1|jgi:hypothetical protein
MKEIIEVYKNPEIEDFVTAEVEVIENLKDGLPFLLQENSVHKDITYILRKFKGKVIIAHSSNLQEGRVYTFKKRKVYKVGINHDASLVKKKYKHKGYGEAPITLIDSFIKVNGVEIY